MRSGRTAGILLTLLVLVGVISGTVLTFLRTPTDPANLLTREAAPGRSGDRLFVDATLRTVDPGTGVLGADLRLTPSPGLVDHGFLTNDITVYVDDLSQERFTTFKKGEDVGTMTVVLPLLGSTILRYPFDDYRATLRIAARIGPISDEAELPIALSVASNLSGYNTTATDQTASDRHVVVGMNLARSSTVILWTLLLMALWWCVALGCAGVASWWAGRSTTVPPWPWTLLAASLFAVPALRNNLPGSPPYGSLVDWASFYWSITIIGASLTVLLVRWNQAIRRPEAEL